VWQVPVVTDDAVTWVTRREGRVARLERRPFRLEIVRGPDKGLAKDFDVAIVRVGARPACELVLTDPTVSGIHFEVRATEAGFLVRDLGSTNGTVVEGLRVVEAFLHPGARVRLGTTEIRFKPHDTKTEVELHPDGRFGPLLGESAAMRALFADLAKISASDATVLVVGETGTGKELVAEAIHGASRRADGPFVVVDCGALPGNLVESELFGHEKGAFTGATSAFKGAFERADGGTILLDEIGELPIDLQPKLLRALERREVRRLGAESEQTVDVRVIAATNRILEREVNRGAFREDLYYRLAVVRVEVPPLRDRPDDVPILARSFALGLGTRLGDFEIEKLGHHAWPGNVRELKNAVERAALLGTVDLSGAARRGGEDAPPEAPPPVDLDVPFREAKARLVEAFERKYAEDALARAGGNVAQAARRAGVDRMSFYKLLARLGIRPERG
jgi:transcriptional regulator with GAF, ATPase, and Fis domain